MTGSSRQNAADAAESGNIPRDADQSRTSVLPGAVTHHDALSGVLPGYGRKAGAL